MTAAAVLSASRLAYPATFLLRSVFSLEDLAGSPIDQMKVLASHALHSFKGLAGCCGIFGEPLLHVLGRVACAQPEPERLCGALGQVGEGGVPVQGDPLWRALAAAGAERICRTFSCRTKSPREGQCPAVPSACKHPPRGGLFNAASDWAACCVITIRRQRNGEPSK